MDALLPDYMPLAQDAGQIRLLQLDEKETGSKNKDVQHSISCIFQIVSLDDYPDYEALSYVWGDPRKDQSILIDNKPVAVTQNLYEALKELQRTSQKRVLWIDAVCINQTDDAERTHQVSRMRYIYERASSVTIYLGSVWDGCAEAFEFFERSARDEKAHYADKQSPCVEVGQKTLGGSEELRSYVGQFFDLIWWKRLWTVQEFVLAKKTVFQCGPHILLEDALLQSFYHVRIHTRTCCSDTPLGSPNTISGLSNWGMFNRIGFLRLLRSWKDTFEIFHLFSSFRTRQSYDPRDKIFGLLGLAHQDWISCIMPDYTQSTEDIYRRIVTVCVEKTGTLEFLSHCYGERGLQIHVPSFVPDWTASIEENSNANYSNRMATECFDASNGATAEMYFITPFEAIFKGLIFDDIIRIGPSTPPARLSPGTLQSWREFAGVRRSIENSIEDITEAEIAFAITLCGGMGSKWTDGDLYLRRATVERDWPLFNKWEAYIASDYDRSTYDNDVANFTTAHVTAAFDRQLVRTSKGHLALVPKATVEADVIAVLAGGKVPYVLRPCKYEDADRWSSLCYTFVGDAYVFGIMDGEVWPDDGSALSQIRMR